VEPLAGKPRMGINPFPQIALKLPSVRYALTSLF